jgi:hypothetical protein
VTLTHSALIALRTHWKLACMTPTGTRLELKVASGQSRASPLHSPGFVHISEGPEKYSLHEIVSFVPRYATFFLHDRNDFFDVGGFFSLYATTLDEHGLCPGGTVLHNLDQERAVNSLRIVVQFDSFPRGCSRSDGFITTS